MNGFVPSIALVVGVWTWNTEVMMMGGECCFRRLIMKGSLELFGTFLGLSMSAARDH